MSNKKRRPSSTIPFGYKLDPEDPKMMIEDEIQQEALSQLKDLEPKFSLRKLCEYVLMKTGRKMTPRGLSKVLNRGY